MVQSPLTTLSQETRWAFSAVLLYLHALYLLSAASVSTCLPPQTYMKSFNFISSVVPEILLDEKMHYLESPSHPLSQPPKQLNWTTQILSCAEE